MYFALLRALGTVLLFMAVLSVPSLYVCFVGKRVPHSDMDPIGIMLFTLANVNVDGSRNVTFAGKVLAAGDAELDDAVISMADYSVGCLCCFCWLGPGSLLERLAETRRLVVANGLFKLSACSYGAVVATRR